MSGSTLTLGLGQNATCTITNNDQPAKLIVKKVLINDNGGTKKFTDFSYKINGGRTVDFEADGSNSHTVDAGTYTVTEIPDSDYTTMTSNCTRVKLGNGETATCTITNNDKAPKLTLVKKVINNNGGTAEKTDWLLSAVGPTSIFGHGGTTSKENFKAGVYALDESGPGGYMASDWDCGHEHVYKGKITIGLGDTVTCTITNDDKAPSLTLLKKVVNKYGSDGKPQDWLLSASGPSSFSGYGTANSPWYNFKAGVYALDESGPGGYTASDWDCGHGKMFGKDHNVLKLKLGEHVTCTITNTRDTGKLTIVKDAQPNSLQEFTFTIEPVATDIDEESGSEERPQQAISAQAENYGSDRHGHHGGGDNNRFGPFTLVDTGANDGKNTRDTALPTGWYRVSEASVDGWDMTGISCGQAPMENKDGVLYVNVTKGAHITCTFTNTQRAQLTIVKDAQPNAPRNFSFTSTIPDGLGGNASFSLTDDGTGTMNSKKFENLKPGTYTITETAVTAWRLDGIACTGSGVTMLRDGYVLTVTLAAGAVASCTFVNTFVPQVLGDGSGALVDTGVETIIAATIALMLTAAAVIVSLQRPKGYVTVRKD